MRDLTKLTAAPLMVIALAGCDLLGSGKKAENKVEATTTKVASAASRLCAANATYAKLKESAFDEAKRIRERDTESLDALADASVLRMENPLLESRDDALGLTVCSGRMILELPPGAGAAFDGRQRLAADVTYSAQAAADGSGTVFKIDGGEPIVYRLAGFDPSRSATRTAAVDRPQMPDADVDDQAAAPPLVAPPAPAPAPAPTSDYAERVAAARARAERAAESARQERTDGAAAARIAREEQAERAAARARQERTAEAERRARAARVAEARRTERGERAADERPSRTARPSFNCRYARSRVEKRICGSEDLAARDRAMANLYYRTNESSDAVVRRRLSASRLRFLAYRDRCPDDACVAAAYEDRMDEINDLAVE